MTSGRDDAFHGSPEVRVGRRRELFWQNVVRDILNALAATAAAFSGRLSSTASGAAHAGSPEHELFDGRMAVITRLGQRIPIADVYPVFACSVDSASAEDRLLSTDVQCTVFQIRTPSGEVYTLPVHEIVSVHAISEALIRRLEEAARASGAIPDGDDVPFGFAAFTSMSQGRGEDVGKPDRERGLPEPGDEPGDDPAEDPGG